MRFEPEVSYGVNAGLDFAQSVLEQIKKNIPQVGLEFSGRAKWNIIAKPRFEILMVLSWVEFGCCSGFRHFWRGSTSLLKVFTCS